jgi:hypothetical protein
LRARVHEQLGYGTFAEYVGRWLGYGYHSTEEKLRVAAALETLPELDRALETGVVSWSAVRELTRVTSPETEREWLTTAEALTVRQLERLVSGRRRGDRPTDLPRAELQRHPLRLEVTGEAIASFRQALEHLRRRSGENLDDSAALLLMAREVLSGPTGGQPSYQVTVSTCDTCARSFQVSKGELIEVDRSVAEMAHCDSHVGAHSKLGRRTRREVLRRDRDCCIVPGCRNTRYVDVHHIRLRSEGGGNDPDNLVVLCSAHHSAVHRGTLRIDGSVSKGLRFQHADGTPYGRAPSAAKSHVGASVFGALRGLGFSEKVARRALDQSLVALPDPTDPAGLLRTALAIARK